MNKKAAFWQFYPKIFLSHILLIRFASLGTALSKNVLISSSSLLSKTGGHFVFATHRTWADIRWVAQPIRLRNSSYTGSSYIITRVRGSEQELSNWVRGQSLSIIFVGVIVNRSQQYDWHWYSIQLQKRRPSYHSVCKVLSKCFAIKIEIVYLQAAMTIEPLNINHVEDQ